MCVWSHRSQVFPWPLSHWLDGEAVEGVRGGVLCAPTLGGERSSLSYLRSVWVLGEDCCLILLMEEPPENNQRGRETGVANWTVIRSQTWDMYVGRAACKRGDEEVSGDLGLYLA